MITGRVDDNIHPLVPVLIRHPYTRATRTWEAWIDTGFTASLILTPEQAADLNLPRLTSTEAAIADGSKVLMDSVLCEIDWLGKTYIVHALVTPGKSAMVGLNLIDDCRLTIDFPARTVEIVLPPTPVP
jgi:clan AA aspartic protease